MKKSRTSFVTQGCFFWGLPETFFDFGQEHLFVVPREGLFITVDHVDHVNHNRAWEYPCFSNNVRNLKCCGSKMTPIWFCIDSPGECKIAADALMWGYRVLARVRQCKLESLRSRSYAFPTPNLPTFPVRWWMSRPLHFNRQGQRGMFRHCI